MTDKSKIIDRVKKLLALATSNNINEAATAAALAQELINKYNLSYLLLGDPLEEKFVKDFRDEKCLYKFSKNLIIWKGVLAKNVADTNHCRTYIFKTPNYKFIGIIGREEDVEYVREIFNFLCIEIERLCIREGKNKGKLWRNNFKLGAVEQVLIMLKETANKSKEDFQKHCSDNGIDKENISNALLKFDNRLKEVDDFIKENMKFAKSRKIKTAYDHSGRVAGQEAAKEINLNNKTLQTNNNNILNQ